MPILVWGFDKWVGSDQIDMPFRGLTRAGSRNKRVSWMSPLATIGEYD